MFGSLSPASGESMLTGSPPSGLYQSPLNSQISASPKAPFLPAFLLGPGHQSTPAENYQRCYQNYPNQLNTSLMSQPPPAPGQHHVTWSPDLIQRIPPTPTSSTISNRFGGPPTKSLEMSDVKQRKEQTYGIPLERLDNSHLAASPNVNLSAAQVDPFYTQGEDFDPANDLDDTWVTVFGFPADAANYILKEFSTYGTIVQHEFASKGNWVHIRYQSPIQAKKALAKNGHLYAQNTIRVGVTPCIDKDVIRRYRRKNVLSEPEDTNSTKRLKTSLSASRIPKASGPPVSSLMFSFDASTPVRSNALSNISARFDTSIQNGSPAAEINRSARIGSMRSLAAAYDGNRQTQNQPDQTTNGSLLSKAWKYIFSQ